jgi:hypothetical protein
VLLPGLPAGLDGLLPVFRLLLLSLALPPVVLPPLLPMLLLPLVLLPGPPRLQPATSTVSDNSTVVTIVRMDLVLIAVLLAVDGFSTGDARRLRQSL